MLNNQYYFRIAEHIVLEKTKLLKIVFFISTASPPQAYPPTMMHANTKPRAALVLMFPSQVSLLF